MDNQTTTKRSDGTKIDNLSDARDIISQVHSKLCFNQELLTEFATNNGLELSGEAFAGWAMVMEDINKDVQRVEDYLGAIAFDQRQATLEALQKSN